MTIVRFRTIGLQTPHPETLKEAIAKEGHVKITGFGNFTVKRKAARKGRNPQTGEELTIASRNVLTFKASPVLKAKISK